MKLTEQMSEKDVKDKGTPQIQKLQNLELILHLEKSQTRFDELYDAGRQIVKKSKFTSKLNQKNLLMAEFWKAIDARYYSVMDEEKLTYLQSAVKRYKQCGEQQSDVVVSSHFSNLIDKVIKPSAFDISDDPAINQANRNNFTSSSYINAVTYGNLMVMKSKNQEPCDKCISNFESVMVNKFDLMPAKRKTQSGVSCYLSRETKNLDKCMRMKSFGFCDSCLRVSTGHHQISLITDTLRSNNEKLAQVKRRGSQLFNLLVKRCKAEDKVKLAINVSLETHIIKEYLCRYLLEIEQKLLVDNVFNIVGKAKNLVVIEFIRIQGVYIINLDELRSWNKYREASLFKLHKCGFKYYNPYYSFNSIDNKMLKKRANIDQQVLENNNYSFNSMQTKNIKVVSEERPLKDEKYICHHCKFKGNSEFFFTCTNRNTGPKVDMREEVTKELLNMKSNYSHLCDRKYCVYCIKNCYHMKIKKSEKKNWLCPFCIGCCYCLSCEYRELYVKIFELFKWYNGDVDEFHKKSPIQKIADYFVKNMKQESLPYKNSFESKVENGFQKLKFDAKPASRALFSIKKYDQNEKEDVSIFSLVFTRRALVDQLALAEQLVKREQIKRKIIDKINN